MSEDMPDTHTPKRFRNFVTFDTRGAVPTDSLYGSEKLYQKEALTKAWETLAPFKIQTPEGEFDEQPAGTFIAEDANGKFYPIAADVMEKTYRQVAGPGARPRNLTTYSTAELITELRNRPGAKATQTFLDMLPDEMLRDELEGRGWEVH